MRTGLTHIWRYRKWGNTHMYGIHITLPHTFSKTDIRGPVLIWKHRHNIERDTALQYKQANNRDKVIRQDPSTEVYKHTPDPTLGREVISYGPHTRVPTLSLCVCVSSLRGPRFISLEHCVWFAVCVCVCVCVVFCSGIIDSVIRVLFSFSIFSACVCW